MYLCSQSILNGHISAGEMKTANNNIMPVSDWTVRAPVSLKNGGTLRLEVNCINVQLPEGLPDYKSDNRILKVCQGLKEKQIPVILVTKDILVRIKAQMIGIEAEDFTTEQAPVSDQQYTGRCEAYVSEKKFENFKKKALSPDDLYRVDEEGRKSSIELVPNQFVRRTGGLTAFI